MAQKLLWFVQTCSRLSRSQTTTAKRLFLRCWSGRALEPVRNFQAVRGHQIEIRENLAGRAIRMNPAAVQHDDPRGQIESHIQIMRRDDLRYVHRPQQIDQFPPASWIEMACRFIERQ